MPGNSDLDGKRCSANLFSALVLAECGDAAGGRARTGKIRVVASMRRRRSSTTSIPVLSISRLPQHPAEIGYFGVMAAMPI